jgi:alkylation response protein AidB-like acyl-CoA dehydrogenase
MAFQLTKDQEVLRDSLREVFGDLCQPSRVFENWHNDLCWDDKLWSRLTADGWFGIAVPEADGGAGLDISELALLAEESGFSGAIGPIFETALAGKFVAAMDASPSRDRYISAITQMGARVAFGLESAWTRNLRDMASGIQAKAHGGAFILEGTCRFTPWAKCADFLLVEALVDSRSALCLIERQQIGVDIRDLETIDPGTSWSDVTLSNVVVVPEHILGTPPSDALTSMIVLTTAGLLGAAKRCLALAIDYAKVRKQFGREIGSFQAVQHLCADMLCGVENLEPAVRFAAACASAGSARAPYYASVARLYAEDATTMVWTNALQIHGGIGFSWEHELHIFLKRTLALQAQYGSIGFYRECVTGSGPAFATA